VLTATTAVLAPSNLLTSGLGRIFAGGHAIDFALISLDPARFPEVFKPSFNVRSYDPPFDLVANR
jgi:hypothetical protein